MDAAEPPATPGLPAPAERPLDSSSPRAAARQKRDRDRYRDDPTRRAATIARATAHQEKPEVIEKRKRRYFERLRFVSGAELDELRRDPTKRQNVCRICGVESLDAIQSVHLQKHAEFWERKQQGQGAHSFPLGGSAEDLAIDSLDVYRLRFGFSKNTALISEEFKAKKRANTEKRGGAEAVAAHARAGREEPLDPSNRKGSRRSLESRLKQSERMSGVARPEFSEIDDAQFVRRFLLEGQTVEEDHDNKRLRRILGVGLNRKRPHLKKRPRVWAAPKPVFAHGDPLSNRWIASLPERFGGVKHWQFGRRFAIPAVYLWQLGRRREETFLTPEFAPRALETEREVFRLLTSASGVTRGSQPSHLKAVVPDLREKLDIAKSAIELLCDFMEQSQVEQDVILNELCARSRKEVETRGPFAARTALCWLPTLLPWLEEHEHAGERSSHLASAFLAHDLGVKAWILERAVSPDTVASAPEVIRALLFSSAPASTAAVATSPKPRGQGSSKKKLSAELMEKGKFCDQVIGEARRIKRLCIDSGKTVAEIRAQHPEFAIWGVREELSEEDRAVFNRPRQWGPVVGYAKMILGKQQGKSAATITEWVKGHRKPKQAT